jgi:hypothetical protein
MSRKKGTDMERRCFSTQVHSAVLCLLIVSPYVFGQSSQGLAPHKKSDTFAVDENNKKIRVQHGELAATNFQIAGVNLASQGNLLDIAARVLGKVSTSASGDAASYDEQACYRSARANDTTHLIFGKGEVNEYFVLTSSGSVKKKNAICLRSGRVTRDSATGAGLKLGMSEEDLISRLGLPTFRSSSVEKKREELRYEFETRKRTDLKEAARWLKDALEKDPSLNVKMFHEDNDFYDLFESIHAQFIDSKLVQLRVSYVPTT